MGGSWGDVVGGVGVSLVFDTWCLWFHMTLKWIDPVGSCVCLPGA